MDEIKQKFGIDVSQALDALKQLDAGYKDHVKTLSSVADVAGRSGKQTQAALKALASQTSTSMASATRSTERFHTSLALLSRIAFTQVVIKGMRTLENSTAGAAREFIGFEKGLSEIQALDPGTSLDSLAKSSQQLSNSFNVKLMDVVAARLDLVGSGFTKASDQAKVFSASAGLAKLGAASQSEATDLLISSLNAYGKTADDAARFSRVFFAGADKGRFTIKELAANLGKAAPAARAVGASIEELTSLFSALTVSGVNPAEAATQSNAIATAFIKPSQAMKEALKQLGVESGQQLIKQRGLAGAIQAVIKATDGSAQSIGKLFINQRALKPILTLNADGFKTFNEHLANTQRLSQQEFDFRLQQRLGTDAERATAAVNKLSNALIVGLGGGITETVGKLDQLTESFGGVEVVAENFFRALTGHGVQDLKQTFFNQALKDINKFEGSLVGVLNKEAEVANRAIEIGKQMGLTAEQVLKLSDNLNQAFSVEKIQAFSKENAAIFADLESRSKNRDVNSELNVRFNASVAALKELDSQSKVTDEELRAVLDSFQSIQQQVGANGFFAGLGEHAAFDASLEKVNKVFENIIQKRNEAAKVPEANFKQAQDAALRLQVATDKWPGNAAEAAKFLLQGAEAVSQSLAQAAAAAAQAGAAAGVQAQASGGIMRLAGGGFAARGTDTIPAMLSPGEFVVNSRSTRRFFSQLQSINAGVAPVFREAGGAVDNSFHVGDINIHAASQPEQTARLVMDKIKREYRRGTR